MSKTMALLELTENITTALDKENALLLILLI